jgi:succinate-acetate transporter protein
MFTTRAISRLLLIVEALLLLFPSLFGLMLFFGGLCQLFVMPSGDNLIGFISSLMAFLSFYSFWCIYTDVVTDEYAKGKKLNQAINLFAFLGFVLSIFSMILVSLSIKPAFAVFGFGVLYVPTYFHLLFELKRQKEVASYWILLTNKS